MEPIEKILEWADDHVLKLEADMEWESGDFGRGHWMATEPKLKGRIRARAAAALDFLDRFAGADSQWARHAQEVYANKGENQSMESGVRAIGGIISEWADKVRDGQVKPRSVEMLGARAVATVDLLEQVRSLNEDATIIPAAPIVLAGAALEIALRSAVGELGLSPSGRPGIATYSKVLRAADVLNRQDMKDIEQIAGLRNAAAHGENEVLSRERAGLMEQQVSLFLDRLEEAVERSA